MRLSLALLAVALVAGVALAAMVGACRWRSGTDEARGRVVNGAVVPTPWAGRMGRLGAALAFLANISIPIRAWCVWGSPSSASS